MDNINMISNYNGCTRLNIFNNHDPYECSAVIAVHSKGHVLNVDTGD